MSYQNTFHIYICRTVELALANVRATAGLLPDAVRKPALHALSYALGLDAAWPTTRELLLGMAPKMEQAGHRTDWMPYLEQGITAGERLGDWPAVAEYQLQLGMLYRMISQFETAKAWLMRSVANFAQGADEPNQARALNELAWVEHLQHHYHNATQYVDQALGLLNANDLERGMSYRVQGMIAIAYKRWQEAEEFHQQALILFEQQGELRKIAWGLQNLAYALRGQERFKEAISNYNKAASILKQEGDIYHLAIVEMNLGLAYYHAGEPEKALKYYVEAESISRNLNDKLQLARINLNFGLAWMSLYEYVKAEQAFYNAGCLYEQMRNTSLCLNAKDGLAMAYLAQSKYAEAESVLRQALIVLPEIENAPNYNYLLRSLNEHLSQARAGQAIIEDI